MPLFTISSLTDSQNWRYFTRLLSFFKCVNNENDNFLEKKLLIINWMQKITMEILKTVSLFDLWFRWHKRKTTHIYKLSLWLQTSKFSIFDLRVFWFNRKESSLECMTVLLWFDLDLICFQAKCANTFFKLFK